MIFDSIEKGLSKKEIVDILNNKKIKTPMEYIKNSDEGKMWNISMIIGILNNKVYIGDLIQQKRKRISFKNHKFVKTKEDELIITKSNHMEIISKEQFERVQDIIKHSVKVNSNNEYDIFSGYLKCKECDSNLTIRKSKEYTYYACSSHVRKRGCNNKHTIRKDFLEEKGTKLLELERIGTIYDVDEQNVCLSLPLNKNTRDTNPENARNLIFFQDGHIRYEWEMEGGILL